MRESEIFVDKEILLNDKSLYSTTINCLETKLDFIFKELINESQYHIYLKEHITTIPLWLDKRLFELQNTNLTGKEQTMAQRIRLNVQNNMSEIRSVDACCSETIQGIFSEVLFDEEYRSQIATSIPVFIFSFNNAIDNRNHLNPYDYREKINNWMIAYFSDWLSRCNQLERALRLQFPENYYRVDTNDESLCHHLHIGQSGSALNLWDTYCSNSNKKTWKHHSHNFQLRREEITIINQHNFIYDVPT